MRRSIVVAVVLAAGLAAPTASGHSAWAQDPLPTSICAIQGDGASSPMKEALVVATGVVIGAFQDTPLNGFFLQAPNCDDEPATSDGIWVFDGRVDARVSEGQLVEVRGEVAEYFGLTEIELAAYRVLTDSLAIVTPVGLDLPENPAEAAPYLERHEGMLVDPGPLRSVAGTNHFGDGYAVPAASDLERVFRGDPDGQRLGLLFPTGWRSLDFGDRLEGAIGPLTYNYDNYKVALTAASNAALAVTPNAALEPDRAAPAGADEVTVASYNLENLFDSIDDPGKDDAEVTVTPERYAVEIARRARSVAEFLGAPDIVGLQEVEKIEVLRDLAAHPLLAGANYAPILVEGDDARGIDVGYLVKRGRFRVVSVEQAGACTEVKEISNGEVCDLPGQSGWLLFSRPPLILRLEALATGGRLSLIVNHFKSKSGGDEATTPTRVAQAAHNRALLDRLKQAEPEVPVLVLGDLNDFPETDPLQVLVGDGRLVDLHGDPRFVPEGRDYSYIFNGVSQILDYILIEPGLPVAAFAPIHANADFGAADPEDDSLDVVRVSDHDPILLRLPLAALPPPLPRLFLPAALANAKLQPGEPSGGEGTPAPGATPTALPSATPLPSPTPPGSPSPTRSPTPVSSPTPQAGQPPAYPIEITELFFDGVEPNTEGDEYIAFRNVAAAPVNLTGWTIVSVKGDQRYRFPTNFTMAPGQTCRVYTDELHPEHCGLSWQNGQGIWSNQGDKAEIRDAAQTLVDWWCYRDHGDQCG